MGIASKRENGFTLIETMAVLTIAAMVSIDIMKQKSKDLEQEQIDRIAHDMNKAFKAIDARIQIDGDSFDNWSGVSINTVSDLKKNLSGSASSCPGIWVPKSSDEDINNSYKSKTLVPCNLFPSGKVLGRNLSFYAEKDAKNRVSKIDIGIKRGGANFTKQDIKKFELIMKEFESSFGKEAAYFSAEFRDSINGSRRPLLSCLGTPNSCIPVFEFNTDPNLRSFNNTYLMINGENGMRGEGYFFQQQNAGSYEFVSDCSEWTLNASGDAFVEDATKKCGFTKDGYIYVKNDVNSNKINAKEGNFENLKVLENGDIKAIETDDGLSFKTQKCHIKVETDKQEKEPSYYTRFNLEKIYDTKTVTDGGEVSCGLVKDSSGGVKLLTTKIDAQNATIDKSVIKNLFAHEIDAYYAKLGRLEADDVKFKDLVSSFASINTLETDLLVGNKANFVDFKSSKGHSDQFTAEDLVANNVNIIGGFKKNPDGSIVYDANNNPVMLEEDDPNYKDSKYIRNDFTNADGYSLVNKGYVDTAIMSRSRIFIMDKIEAQTSTDVPIYVYKHECIDGYSPEIEVNSKYSYISDENGHKILGAWAFDVTKNGRPAWKIKVGSYDCGQVGFNDVTRNCGLNLPAKVNITLYCKKEDS